MKKILLLLMLFSVLAAAPAIACGGPYPPEDPTPTPFPATATPPSAREIVIEELPLEIYDHEHRWVFVVEEIAESGCNVGDSYYYPGVTFRSSVGRSKFSHEYCIMGDDEVFEIEEGIVFRRSGGVDSLLLHPNWVLEPFE